MVTTHYLTFTQTVYLQLITINYNRSIKQDVFFFCIFLSVLSFVYPSFFLHFLSSSFFLFFFFLLSTILLSTILLSSFHHSSLSPHSSVLHFHFCLSTILLSFYYSYFHLSSFVFPLFFPFFLCLTIIILLSFYHSFFHHSSFVILIFFSFFFHHFSFVSYHFSFFNFSIISLNVPCVTIVFLPSLSGIDTLQFIFLTLYCAINCTQYQSLSQI